MSTDPLSFLDESDFGSKRSQSDPLDFLGQTSESIDPVSGHPTSERPGKFDPRKVGMSLKTIGSTVAGVPGDIASLAGRGVNWVAEQFGRGKTEEELSGLINNPFTSENIKHKVEEFAPSLAPQNQAEQDWDDALGLLTSLATPGLKSKAINKNTLKEAYQAGRRLGMSEKELAPLAHGKITQKVLGLLSKGSKRARESLQATQEGLGKSYDLIKLQGSRSTLSPTNINTLENSLSRFRNSLEKTIGMSPDTKAVISHLDESIGRLKSAPRTGEDLVNWYQEINKVVNWNAMKGGKKKLAEVKDMITRSLAREDPVLAKNFGHINKLWGQSESILKNIGEENFINLVKKHPTISTLAGLVGLKFGSIAAPGTAAYIASRPIALKILTDPKWSNLQGKAFTAIKNKSPKAAAAVLHAIRTKAKEELSSEEFDEIDWGS